MHTHKLFAAGAAIVALAAIPAAIVWSASSSSTAADTPRTNAVAASPSAPPGAQPGPGPIVSSRETAAAPARGFRGRVVDADGKPLAGAIVRKTPLRSFESRVESGELTAADASAKAGDDGGFTLNDAGVRGGKVSVAAELDGWIAREQTTPCGLDAAATIVMLRTHEVPLTVECVERPGRLPVPRFRVTGSTTLKTRFNGRVDIATYELRVPDRDVGTNGSWRGTARFVEGMPFVVQVCCAAHGEGPFGRGTDPRLRTTLQPVPGAPLHVVIEFEQPAPDAGGGPIQRGRVVADATDEPVPGVDVYCLSPEPDLALARARIAADGSFEVALPKNGARAMLQVEHDDWQTRTIAPDPDTELVVRLRPRAQLTVKVVDRLGAPVAGTHVLVHGVRDERFHHRTRTDAAGTIVLTGLLADRYTVYLVPSASAPDEEATTSGSYPLEAGQRHEATLELEPRGAVPVAGRVTGAPAGLTAAYLPYEGTGRLAPARLKGADYDAGSLHPGDYLVLLLAANDDHRHLPNALLPKITVRGPGPQGIDLMLPTGFVRGRVETSRDRSALRMIVVPELPPGGVAADFLARDKTTKFLGAPLGADGAFELKHIADGPWLLQAREGANVVAQRTITVQGSLDVGDWAIER